MQIEGFIDATPILSGGIYALVHRGEIVYIGKAKRMLNRVQAHLSVWAAKRKEKVPSWLPIRGIYYDSVFIRPEHPDRIDALERQMIDLYKPRYNTKLKTPEPTSAPFSISVGNRVLAFNHTPRIASTELVRRL